MTTHLALTSPGGQPDGLWPGMTIPVAGWSCIQLVGPNDAWFDGFAAHARKHEMPLFVDDEQVDVAVGGEPTQDMYATTMGRRLATAKLAAAKRRVDGNVAKVRAAMPGRVVGYYGNVPFGFNDLSQWAAVNARIADAGVFAAADVMCASAYLLPAEGTVSIARAKTRAMIAQAKQYQRRVMLFVRPTFEGTATPIPDEVLAAQLDECRDAGVDACVWQDGVADPVPIVARVARAVGR